MQTALISTADIVAQAAALNGEAPAATLEISTPAKPVRAPRAKRTTKPVANVVAETVAKPVKRSADDKQAAADKREAERADKLDNVRTARKLAANAVAEYYRNASLPFKAAADRFADLRLDKQPKRASERQAALLCSMLLAGDNIKRNGEFTRGAFVIDGRNVQPETGCLSDMLGRVIHYVSGPTSGNAQRDAIFRVDFKQAHAEITALIGGKLAGAALAKLASLGFKPAPVKPVKA